MQHEVKWEFPHMICLCGHLLDMHLYYRWGCFGRDMMHPCKCKIAREDNDMMLVIGWEVEDEISSMP